MWVKQKNEEEEYVKHCDPLFSQTFPISNSIVAFFVFILFLMPSKRKSGDSDVECVNF